MSAMRGIPYFPLPNDLPAEYASALINCSEIVETIGCQILWREESNGPVNKGVEPLSLIEETDVRDEFFGAVQLGVS